MTQPADTLEVHDLEPTTDDYRDEVIDGLSQSPKRLPSKLFYDQRGSKLFEDICELDEYYLTRTELAIMQANASAMARRMGEGVALIEPGSGASVKTRLLLNALPSPAAYVPVDISRDHLTQAAGEVNSDYPRLLVAPVCADFTQFFEMPANIDASSRRVVYFPGSTIGNFEPPEAVELLRNFRRTCSGDGDVLIGIDRKKEVAMLEAAYNDAHGVTAAFNRNMLTRINAQLDADFDEDLFEHRSHYNHQHGRIEMHLVSGRSQSVRLNGHQFSFDAGETICTEFSYKFSLDDFARLAHNAGFRVDKQWSDDNELFSVLYLAADGRFSQSPSR